jgi:hypothetical protein
MSLKTEDEIQKLKIEIRTRHLDFNEKVMYKDLTGRWYECTIDLLFIEQFIPLDLKIESNNI